MNVLYLLERVVVPMAWNLIDFKGEIKINVSTNSRHESETNV